MRKVQKWKKKKKAFLSYKKDSNKWRDIVLLNWKTHHCKKCKKISKLIHSCT